MRFTLALVLASFLLTAGVSSSWGQATVSLNTGMRGTVKDSSGSVIMGASVKLLSNVAPPVETKTDGEGKYAFSGLRIGTYHVVVNFSGFEEYTGKDVAIETGIEGVNDIQLVTAGAGAQTVTVNENAGHVEINDSTVSNTLGSQQIEDTPTNGRVFTQLINLTAGTVNQSGQDEARVGAQGSAAFSVNGGRVEYNAFSLDGTDLLNVGFNGSINSLIVFPSIDGIGEMKVLTSNYGSQYGRTASGTIILSTKSGTSEFHGDAYYFVRNEAMNARNFFDETKNAPLYRRNDLGMTLGGPLFIPNLYNTKKEKTFFFISEEYRSEETPFEFNQGVPSAAERKGNFSDVCPAGKAGTAFLPSVYPDCPGNQADSSGNDHFGTTLYTLPGNRVPFFSSDAAAILSTGIIPAPNATSGCNSSINSCYVQTVSEPTHWREELGRIDHYFNEKNRATFRYIHDAWSTITATPQYGVVTNSFPTIQNNFTGPGTSLLGRFSQTLSPTLLNEVFLSYANSTIWLTDRNGPNGSTFLTPSALTAPCALTASNPSGTCPLGSIFQNGGGGKLPGLDFITSSAYGGGFAVDPSYMPWYHKNPVITFGDTMSKQWGQHFFQFGAEFLLYYRTQTNSVNGAATGDTQGLLTLSNNVASFTGLNNPISVQGNAFFNFLQQGELTSGFNPVTFAPTTITIIGGGGIQSYQQDSAQLMYRQRYQLGEPFFQDDWKVTPRLTVNLGVRLSLFGRYHEANDNVYNWVPSAYNSLLASQVQFNSNNNLAYTNSTGIPIYYSPSNPPAQLLNGLERCGYNGVPAGCMTGHLFNPAPRVGFAWDPFGDGKTSIRSGYGIFFEHGTGSETNTGSLEGSAPLVLSSTTSSLSASLSCIGGSNPAVCNATFHPGEIAATPIDLTSIQTKTQWPYAQQWSFSLQRELPKGIIATLSYVGSKGTHLTAERQINALQSVPASQNPFSPGQPLTAGDCTTTTLPLPAGETGPTIVLTNGQNVLPGSPAYNNISAACNQIKNAAFNVDPYRPYYGLGRIFSLSNVANSSYNSLQFTAKRTSGPLTMGIAYTYSHSLDDSSDRFDAIPDAFNLKSNYASSNFDQRQALSISYVLSVPIPKSFSTNQWLTNTLGGWQVSGITVYQAGTPFSIINDPQGGTFTADNAGVGNSLIGTSTIQSYADVVASKGSAIPAGGNNGQSFGPLLYNPGMFAPPQGLTFGNSGRNYLNNPSRYNFDVSLFKNFKLSEKQSFQVRGEAFNVLNNTQFEIYNPAKGNQPNNTVTCYGQDSSGQYTAGAPQCLVGNSFLRPIDAHRSRTLQIALKFFF